MSTTASPHGPDQQADAERIRDAIGYGPVMVSGHTGGQKWGGLTYRTAQDVDDLVQRLLPVLAQVRAEAAQGRPVGRLGGRGLEPSRGTAPSGLDLSKPELEP